MKIKKVEDFEDGSTLYQIGAELEAATERTEEDFYRNLAIDLDKSERQRIARHLLDAIDEDLEARQEWMESVEKVQEFLGFSIEDLDDIPFERATRTYDTTLATSLVRYYATARSELFPQTGPAGFEIRGQTTDELEAQGAKIRDYFNYYLTTIDEAYYPDSDRCLLYTGLYGSGFKKVYYDPILKRPISRFIHPKDFIVNGDCSSIMDSDRLTHVLHLSKREILLNQSNGTYIDINLKYLKTGNVDNELEDNDIYDGKYGSNDIDLNVYTKKALFPIYETHAYLNLEEIISPNAGNKDSKVIPAPYRITIDPNGEEVLALYRNWAPDDEEKKRINYFVQYNYLPGFGIYGLGLAHLIGSNAITLTQLLRQLVDAGKFKNLPGGLRAKGFKAQENDIIVGPGQFVEVDTGGVPLAEAFMPLPYSGPCEALRQLRLEIVEQCKELSSVTNMEMLNSKEDIPMGTTLALLEHHNKIQSCVLRSLHMSLSRELLLLDSIFRATVEPQKFGVKGQVHTISPADFAESIVIVPVSDPSMNSSMHRIMKAESIMRVAQSNPELHNMRAVYKLNYEAQGVDPREIDNILKPEAPNVEALPLDPVTENINALQGEPLKAAIWQAHSAHKLMHGLFAEQHPDLQPILMAHIKEHEAYEYMVQMQELLGQELPPLDQIMAPEVQNAIALGIATKMNDMMPTGEEQGAPPLDQNTILMAELEQKAAEIAAKERMAAADIELRREEMYMKEKVDAEKLKAEAFKAQLAFEADKAKLESNEAIQALKENNKL